MREIYDPVRQRVPVRVWARAPPTEAIRQLVRIANEPWAVDFVAAMADVHVAEGVAVGTVFATERTVVPRALGGDLGCGMAAMRLSVEAARLDRATLVRLVDAGTAAHP
jgi:tRNA-splicing ligase RtcB